MGKVCSEGRAVRRFPGRTARMKLPSRAAADPGNVCFRVCLYLPVLFVIGCCSTGGKSAVGEGSVGKMSEAERRRALAGAVEIAGGTGSLQPLFGLGLATRPATRPHTGPNGKPKPGSTRSVPDPKEIELKLPDAEND